MARPRADAAVPGAGRDGRRVRAAAHCGLAPAGGAVRVPAPGGRAPAGHRAELRGRPATAEVTGLPVLVKGILRGDDAVASLDAGAAGIAVSNHGGRQIDGSITTAEALPEIVEAVAGRGVVLVDGGIRQAEDVVRALALGADAVLLGRPVAWALARGGATEVSRLLTDLADDVVAQLALCGVKDVRELTPDLVRWRAWG